MTAIKPNLLLGGYREAGLDISKWYSRLGATHVICVAAEIEPPRPQGMTVAHMPLADDEPAEDITKIFEKATAFVKEAFEKGGRVLIHCRRHHQDIRKSHSICEGRRSKKAAES